MTQCGFLGLGPGFCSGCPRNPPFCLASVNGKTLTTRAQGLSCPCFPLVRGAALNGAHCSLCPEPGEAPGGGGCRLLSSAFQVRTLLSMGPAVPSCGTHTGRVGWRRHGLRCPRREHVLPTQTQKLPLPSAPEKKTRETQVRVGRGRSPRSEPTMPLTPCNLLSHVTSLSTNQVFRKQ